MVISHPETVRKLHAWHTDFGRILKRSAFITYELHTPWDIFSMDDAPQSTLYLDPAASFHIRPVTETSSTSTAMASA